MILKNFKAAAIMAAAFLISVNCYALSQVEESQIIVKYQYPDDYGMWKHIFKRTEAYKIPQTETNAIIIPHHDITVSHQSSFYKALAQQKSDYDVIVLISPDHFEKGTNLITIPENTIFETPEKQLELYEPLNSHLTNPNNSISKFVSPSSEPWKIEHGIFAHTPFLKHYFPQSNFFPILLKSFSKEDEFFAYEKLAEELNKVLPKNSLVIASVDFSHYQIPRMTNLHDFVSMNAIVNSEDLKYIEVDSPESLTVVTKFSQLRNLTKPVLINKTSTYDFIPDDFIVSTSHQYWAFYNEENSKQAIELFYKQEFTKQRILTTDFSSTKNQTILIGGSGTTDAGIRTFWKWDRYKESKDFAEKNLQDLAGTEARFLNGFDALLFELNEDEKFIHTKHGTTLFINGMNNNNSEKHILPEEILNQKNNQINIAFINCTSLEPKKILNQKKSLTKLLSHYEVVILHDTTGTKDSFAMLANDSPKGYELINLGIIAGNNKKAKGTILCINWHNNIRQIELFDYSSNSNFPPAIFQGEL